MDKVELKIIAISSSHSQTGAYALILGEVGGNRKLPIIIGAFEAQSIAIAIEGIKTTRPLTHDLFKHFIEKINIKITEVIIYKYSNRIFFSKLIFFKDDKKIEIDSRTSDAVALAIRFNCPVYIYESILKATGIIIEEENPYSTQKKESNQTKNDKENEFANIPTKKLNELLSIAIEKENYKRASVIRDEINKRKIK